MLLTLLTTIVLPVLAQATEGAEDTGAAEPLPWWQSPIIPIMGIMLIFLVLGSRSRRNQERQKQQMLDAMKRGDRVQTIGGILGNVVEVRPEKILVKVDESSNTKIWFSRNAIARVLEEEKAEAK